MGEGAGSSSYDATSSKSLVISGSAALPFFPFFFGIVAGPLLRLVVDQAAPIAGAPEQPASYSSVAVGSSAAGEMHDSAESKPRLAIIDME